MALTTQQTNIQAFLTACNSDTNVPGTTTKTRDMVNDPAKVDEMKVAFQMVDSDHVIYRNFWRDFFDLANYIGPTKESQTGTIACCCSCCLSIRSSFVA